jgi:hypothetical protein
MKFRFLSSTTLGIVTFFLLILILFVLRQMNPLSAIAVGILSMSFIALSGNLGRRARFFYWGYGVTLFFIGGVLGVVVVYQAFSGAPKIGMLVGSERLPIVQSTVFQTEVLDKVPAQLNKNEVKTVGSLGQVTEVETGNLDLKTTQLFWAGDVGQTEPLLEVLKSKGLSPNYAETFYDPLVVLIEMRSAQLIATKQNHLRPIFNDPVFAYEIDTEWLADILSTPGFTWQQLGLLDYQEPVKIVFSNPVTSAGGQLSLMLFSHFWDKKVTGTPGINVPLNAEVTRKIQQFSEGLAQPNSSGEVINELTRRGYTPWAITYQSTALTEKNKWQGRFVLAKLAPTIVSANVMVGIGEVGFPLVQQLKIEGSSIHQGMLTIGKQFNYAVTPTLNAITPPSRKQLIAVQHATGLCKVDGGNYSCH